MCIGFSPGGIWRRGGLMCEEGGGERWGGGWVEGGLRVGKGSGSGSGRVRSCGEDNKLKVVVGLYRGWLGGSSKRCRALGSME